MVDSELVEMCHQHYRALDIVRYDRARNIRYKNGYHWSEYVDDPNRHGHKIKEEDLITREGKMPLKHNFISQFVRNITGQIIRNPSQSVVRARSRDSQQLSEILTNTLQTCLKLNQSAMIDITVAEELILTGFSCSKVRFDYVSTKDRCDGDVTNVNFNRLFFNCDLSDNRFRELRLIGEIHDFTLEDILLTFASSASEGTRLRKLFLDKRDDSKFVKKAVSNDQKAHDMFYQSEDPSKFRIIEVWQKKGRWSKYLHDYLDGSQKVDNVITQKEIDKINEQRVITGIKNGLDKVDIPIMIAKDIYEYYWNVTFITTDGNVLREMETPFSHQEHPYILTALPMINGEIKSLIGDVIDIQRYINRLIMMIDFIIGSSAKGVLMVPENSIPDGYNIEDFTNEYVKTNGVIVYKPNNTRDIPFQISSNSTNVGAWEMLNLQMTLIQQISGISGAIQGQDTRKNTAASLYSQQAQNSQLNYLVLFETLKIYQQNRDEKLLRVLMQFYKEQRYIDTNGSIDTSSVMIYDPMQIENMIDFSLTISRSMETPVFRDMFDSMLLDLLNGGHIDIEMFLSNSSLPFSDRLLSQIGEIKAKKITK